MTTANPDWHARARLLSPDGRALVGGRPGQMDDRGGVGGRVGADHNRRAGGHAREALGVQSVEIGAFHARAN